ncbi:hypothetical protein HV213_15500 [Klebsiella sp. RHBSTW-00484]|uniref:hypothetical protein n=1 Tax=unclassified Klebsiella TaxID=2608929 RepID=UPI0015E596D9|nr:MULTISPECIES: hypothetical protein [unclassified Klebsiella]MBA7846965.1 hypothetical protein [Klebsiella sp. RHBSTW-00465]QLO37124.1 hypothetical protein HV213_15500 [Klebsiella sp. RHBSTW-00484]QLT76642.1 hypothetical protein HV204_15500 [Klebsiella sp. RHBSTW-00464]
MKRSTCRLLAGTIMSIMAASAQALKAPEVDLRNPTIWEEKTVNPLADKQQPCEVYSGPNCSVWEDEKSDIQRERERREQRRWQNGYENLRRE